MHSPLKAEIILIGNELLIGKIKDTNGAWLIERLLEHGCFVTQITTIPDHLETIAHTIRDAIARKPRFILTSGGLGPTFDDMTLKGVAQGLGVRLEQDMVALEMIGQRYMEIKNILSPHLLDKVMTHARVKMSYLPKGSKPLKNPEGAAPCVQYDVPGQHTTIFCMPGIPKELMAIYTTDIAPQVAAERVEFFNETFFSKGVGESDIADFVAQLMHDIPGIWIKSHPKGRGTLIIEWQVTSFGTDELKTSVSKAITALQAEILHLGGKISDAEDFSK